MEPNSIPENCPYKPGAILHLCQGSASASVRIEDTFRGGDEENYYTNSCTVLVDVVEGNFDYLPTSPEIRAGLVLKIFDWRYSAQIRNEYGVDDWNAVKQEVTTELDSSDAQEFERYLLTPLSESERQHSWVVEQLENNDMPVTPTRMDLFGAVLRETCTAALATLLADGLIQSKPTPVQREIFLRLRNLQAIATECEIARRVAKCPGENLMPHCYGDFLVCVDDGSAGLPDVHGMLMGRVPGRTLAEIGIKNVKLSFDKARNILHQAQAFHFQLWRHNLMIVDTNVHNFCIQQDGDEAKLMFVDYGGLIMVNPELDIRSVELIQVRMQSTNLVSTVLFHNYSQYFNGFAECEFNSAIACAFGWDTECYLETLQNTATDYHGTLERVPSEHQDTFFDVMDQLLPCNDVESPDLAFERFLYASQTLKQGMSNNPSAHSLVQIIRTATKDYPGMMSNPTIARICSNFLLKDVADMSLNTEDRESMSSADNNSNCNGLSSDHQAHSDRSPSKFLLLEA